MWRGVQRLVADGVKRDGARRLSAFLRNRREPGGFGRVDFDRRGLEGEDLLLTVIEGGAGVVKRLPGDLPALRSIPSLGPRWPSSNLRNLQPFKRAAQNGKMAPFAFLPRHLCIGTGAVCRSGAL